jgi:sec-independent protein translocase protein TatB
MSFLDKAKAAAQEGVAKAKEGVEDVQTKRDQSQAYGELGKETYRLIEAGEISHPSLDPIAQKIRATEQELAEPAPAAQAAPAAAPAESAAAAEPAAPPPPPDQPPAMPS